MEQERLEQIITQAVEAVLKRLIASAPRKNVLILFSGASSGYVAGVEAIRFLSQGGHSIKVILTSAANYVIGEENIRKAGAQEIINTDQMICTPRLIEETDLVLVPTLSMNTAAHLALGLMNSLICTVVLGGLLAGKPIITICDGADPYGDGGKVFGSDASAAPLLRERYAYNLSTLTSYGIVLVRKEQFLLTLTRHVMRPAQKDAPNDAPPIIKNADKAAISSAVITVSDLRHFSRGQTVQIPHRARLTPLAKEYASQIGLNLVEG
ncbi:MAG: flavoprotein [Chloroflexota bacterium]|jgi:hypothetical protein